MFSTISTALFSLLPLLALTSLSANAAPTLTPRSTQPTDTQILQYALTLEHLEATFYREGLNRFPQSDFSAAGFPSWVRDRMLQIGGHEAQHVDLLTGALGKDAVAECTYKFPYEDVKGFVGLAAVLESVGVSAYLGAAASIVDKTYLTVAGSILTTEARHQGWINSAGLRGAGWSGPEDTPLDFNEVYSLAAPFITSCPAANPALPFKPFPSLTVAADGSVTYPNGQSGQYLLINSGLTSKTFPINDNKVQLPANIQGFAYAVVTSEQDATKVNDDNIVAGVAILSYPFDSRASNPAATLQ